MKELNKKIVEPHKKKNINFYLIWNIYVFMHNHAGLLVKYSRIITVKLIKLKSSKQDHHKK